MLTYGFDMTQKVNLKKPYNHEEIIFWSTLNRNKY